MEPRDLEYGEVEALAKHEVRSADLRLGYAAQHAAEDAVEHKLARLLALSGAEPVDIEIEWVCTGRAIGRKSGRVVEERQVKYLPAPPEKGPPCSVCGTHSPDVKLVPVRAEGELLYEENRCHVHA